METLDNKDTASEIINFQSGVNLGYSLGLWNETPEVIQTVNTIANKNSHLPFCRGLNKGYERAMLDRREEKHFVRDQRMNEILIAQNKTKDEKDLER